MNWTSIAQSIGPLATTAIGLVGFGARRRRVRADIAANMQLLGNVESHPTLSQVAVLNEWLVERIALDIARVTGVRLGNQKKPFEWSSFVLSVIIGVPSGYFAWSLSRHDFNWWSVPLWVLAGLMAVSAWGHFLNREVVPDSAQLPDRMAEADGGGVSRP